MRDPKGRKWYFDVCVLDGNFEVNCDLEGSSHCILKVILIGNFKNQIFVVLQGRSGSGKCQENFWQFRV